MFRVMVESPFWKELFFPICGSHHLQGGHGFTGLEINGDTLGLYGTTVDGSEIPAKHLGCNKTL